MSTPVKNPFELSAEDLHELLSGPASHLPELETYRATPQKLADTPQAQTVLAQTEPIMADIERIPQTNYTEYRQFVRNGDREGYQQPYFAKRTRLGAVALRLFMGQTHAAGSQGPALKDVAQDLIWDICEETNWVVPAHERRQIDLFAAETAFELAETMMLLGDTLDAEIRQRIRREIDRRIFDPYLRFHQLEGWYNGGNNWNGVCNSSIAAAFCLLQPETMGHGVRIALDSLRVFLDTAFEADGSSTEGVAYWHYGLINFVALAEMLRARSGGAIDLLDSEQMRKIAAYPAKMHLSGSWFASFSDCGEQVVFNPGILVRLAERTGEQSLLGLLAKPAEPGSDWRAPMMLRNLLWWNGKQPDAPGIQDAVLPEGGVARVVVARANKPPVVLAIKAGHNAENHNQNDVGSFIVHVDGENLLTDPGRGLYNRAYFSNRRYENIFANSYGHSVPRLLSAGANGGDGQDGLQAPGAEYRGEFLGLQEASGENGPQKQVAVEFGRAYPVDGLASARRQLVAATDGDAAGTAWLEDVFRFDGEPHQVEEAFVTWFDVSVDGATAEIEGQRHKLRLTIEEPQGASFALESLENASRENKKEGILKRLSFRLPANRETQTRLRMEVHPAS